MGQCGRGHPAAALRHRRLRPIDTAADVQAVSGAALEVLDRGVRTEYSSGLLRIYGFMNDRDWVGHVIRFSEAVRSTAHDHMIACGLGGN